MVASDSFFMFYVVITSKPIYRIYYFLLGITLRLPEILLYILILYVLKHLFYQIFDLQTVRCLSIFQKLSFLLIPFCLRNKNLIELLLLCPHYFFLHMKLDW